MGANTPTINSSISINCQVTSTIIGNIGLLVIVLIYEEAQRVFELLSQHDITSILDFSFANRTGLSAEYVFLIVKTAILLGIDGEAFTVVCFLHISFRLHVEIWAGLKLSNPNSQLFRRSKMLKIQQERCSPYTSLAGIPQGSVLRRRIQYAGKHI